MKRFITLVVFMAAITALAGCSNLFTPVHAQALGPGTVQVTWTAPTTNTNGSPLTPNVTYAVYEVTGSGSSTVTIGTDASGVVGDSATLTNVPDGTHCYDVQTVEVLYDGATVSSALSNPPACIDVSGSAAAQTNPNSPTHVKAQVQQ